MRWEFRNFGEIKIGTVFNVFPFPQNKRSPPPNLTAGMEALIVNNDERIPVKVLKADRSEILLASDKFPTLRLGQVVGGNRRFGRVGPSMLSEDWQVEQLLPPAR